MISCCGVQFEQQNKTNETNEPNETIDNIDNADDDADGEEEANDDADDDDEQPDDEVERDEMDVEVNNDEPRRSERERKPVSSYEPTMSGQKYDTSNFVTQVLDHATYDDEYALMLVRVITELRERAMNAKEGVSFAETYSLNKGMKVLGEKGKQAAFDEVEQLHKRGCFSPVDVKKLSKEERGRVLESLIFLTQKRDGSAKARACVDGRPQRLWMDKDEAASPTVLLESVMLTSVIDAKEEREVAVVDIPNAFVQTEMEGDRVVMKMRGKLAELLVKVSPEVYRNYVTVERGQTVLYVELQKALYGMLKSALLFYRKLRKDLESIGFTVNPYDPCVANMMQGGSQLTVVWHVDDLKISHKQKEVVDDLISWLRHKYEDDNGKVKESRGKVHDYLGMDLDFSEKGAVKIKMKRYVEEMVSKFPFPDEIKKAVASPASDFLFRVNEEGKKIDEERAQTFHNVVAKGLFLCKRARPDIMTAIAFLCTRV